MNKIPAKNWSLNIYGLVLSQTEQSQYREKQSILLSSPSSDFCSSIFVYLLSLFPANLYIILGMKEKH
jgi:hypothetical protein